MSNSSDLETNYTKRVLDVGAHVGQTHKGHCGWRSLGANHFYIQSLPEYNMNIVVMPSEVWSICGGEMDSYANIIRGNDEIRQDISEAFSNNSHLMLTFETKLA